MENTNELLTKTNTLLASSELRPKAKAFLLLKLCQITMSVAPEKAQLYWEQLASIKGQLPKDEVANLSDLTQVFEGEKEPKKGFAAEKIKEINELLNNAEISEDQLRSALKKIEEEVKKRFRPFGKIQIWKKLVLVWKEIDRNEALSLSAKLTAPIRKPIVQKMNQEKRLTADEWSLFTQANSQNEAVKIILMILAEPQPSLDIPDNLIEPSMNDIRSKLSNIQSLKMVLDDIAKFVKVILNEERKQEIFSALKNTIRFFSKSYVFNQQWAEQFNACLNIIVLGVNSGVITLSNVIEFIDVLPRHMKDFGKASCFGLLADGDNARKLLSDLLEKAQNGIVAEAWFLALLTERGFSSIALDLAGESPRAGALIPRIQRACLCCNLQGDQKNIDQFSFVGDTVAEFMCQTPGQERVDYLRKETQSGQKSVPGALWASEKPQDEKKGFWASMLSSGKTLDEVIKEYLKRNPLYSSYNKSTQPPEQFKEYLRFRGYGEYHYGQIDQALLRSLVTWGEEYPEEVKALIAHMWSAILPEDDILKLNFLRNAIFNRCTTVFAASPDALKIGFLAWIKKRLVEKSLSWQIGKTQFTLHFPETFLSTFALQSALAVHEISPDRRDRLIEIALTNYPSNDNVSETAARLYNTGKELLDINLPWQTKTDVVTGWQLGIVKNAIPFIVRAMINSAQQTT